MVSLNSELGTASPVGTPTPAAPPTTPTPPTVVVVQSQANAKETEVVAQTVAAGEATKLIQDLTIKMSNTEKIPAKDPQPKAIEVQRTQALDNKMSKVEKKPSEKQPGTAVTSKKDLSVFDFEDYKQPPGPPPTRFPRSPTKTAPQPSPQSAAAPLESSPPKAKSGASLSPRKSSTMPTATTSPSQASVTTTTSVAPKQAMNASTTATTTAPSSSSQQQQSTRTSYERQNKFHHLQPHYSASHSHIYHSTANTANAGSIAVRFLKCDSKQDLIFKFHS